MVKVCSLSSIVKVLLFVDFYENRKFQPTVSVELLSTLGRINEQIYNYDEATKIPIYSNHFQIWPSYLSITGYVQKRKKY